MEHNDDRPSFGPAEMGSAFYSSRRRGNPALRRGLIIGGCCGAAVTLLAFCLWFGSRSRSSEHAQRFTEPPIVDGTGSSAAPTSDRQMSASTPYSLRPDDGKILWASPSEGRPIDLRHCPQGAQLLVYLRPADLLHHPEGTRCWRALDFNAATTRTHWERSHQVNLAEISEMILAWVPRGPDIDLVVTARWDRELPEAWRDPPATRPSDSPSLKWVQRGEQSVLLYEQDRPTIVWGRKERLDSIAEQGDRPPLLRREMESLWRRTSEDQQVIVLLPPQFLSRDGRHLFGAGWQRIIDGFDWLLGDGVQATMIALEFGRHEFFVELRTVPTWESTSALGGRLPERLRQLPQLAEDWIVAQPEIDPFWRRLVLRFPAMLRFASQQIRSGTENREVIVRGSWPAKAAHNLLLGAHWAASLPVNAVPSRIVARPEMATVPTLLDLPITLSFRQESFASALAGLEEAVRDKLPQPADFAIEFDGRELQLEGITRNQQLRQFQAVGMPLRDALNLIVAMANPDRSAAGLSDPAQKLVWLLDPSSNGSTAAVIRITTRAGAERDRCKLPDVFRIP